MLKFKAYVLSPSSPGHGGYVVLDVPPYAKNMDEASQYASETVAKLRKRGVVVVDWWVVKEDD